MKQILFILMLSWIGCTSENIPIAGEQTCYWEQSEDFNFTLAKWEKSEITYFIKDYPKGMAEKDAMHDVGRAASLWSEHAGIPLVQIYQYDKADIVISIDKLDGLGGTLGRSGLGLKKLSVCLRQL